MTDAGTALDLLLAYYRTKRALDAAARSVDRGRAWSSERIQELASAAEWTAFMFVECGVSTILAQLRQDAADRLRFAQLRDIGRDAAALNLIAGKVRR